MCSTSNSSQQTASDIKVGEYGDDSNPSDDCASCCRKYFVVTFRRKQHIVGGSKGTWKLEVWDSVNAGSGKLVNPGSGDFFDQISPACTSAGCGRQYPAGEYGLGTCDTQKHKSYNYNRPRSRPHIALRLYRSLYKSGLDPSNRGIDIHLGDSISWTEGCLIFGKNIQENNTRKSIVDDSYVHMVALIRNLHSFKGKTFNGGQTTSNQRLPPRALPCVKVLIVDDYTN